MITWERSKDPKSQPYTLDGTINGILVYEIRPSGSGTAYGNGDFDLFMHNIADKTTMLGLAPSPAYLFDVDSWETGKEMAEEHFGVVTAMLGLTMKEKIDG